jgi:hypothetical protein
MATIDVKDAANVTQTVERPLAPGQATMLLSRPVVIASNQSAVPVTGTVIANAGSGTQAVSLATLPALPAGTNNIGDVDVITMPAITGSVSITGTPTVVANVGTGTQVVSGTVTANAGTGTLTITGAVTNAGTFVTQESGAALTSLQLIDDIIVAPGTALGTTKNSLTGGSVTTAAPTYTTGQISPLSLDTAGGLRVGGTVTANVGTGVTKGAGPADGTTLRVTMDTGQVGALVKGGVPVVSGGYEWFWFAASVTNSAVQNTTGAVGDYIESIICVVATPATSQVQIKDGSGTARTILPANVAGGINSYELALGYTSKLGAWQISTQAGVTVFVSGRFT